jgi:hypothetical protein
MSTDEDSSGASAGRTVRGVVTSRPRESQERCCDDDRDSLSFSKFEFALVVVARSNAAGLDPYVHGYCVMEQTPALGQRWDEGWVRSTTNNWECEQQEGKNIDTMQ